MACARAAGLRYVECDAAGIIRELCGGKFVYRDGKGRVIKNKKVVARIQALVIPPAWTNVWICPHADGHVQATGRDARGRKQYRYHAHWNSARDDGKYGRMIEFATALPHIRKRVEADLKKTPLSRDHVLATVVRLLEKTLIRIGNEEYARANKSFGLTTLRDSHVQIKGSSLTFHFRAKSGVVQTIAIDDATLARFVKNCRELPGPMLFQYLDGECRRQCLDSTAVNAYLREITGKPFTAKNFRTWSGTVLVAKALCEVPPATTEAAFKRNTVKAVDLARERLGNTRAVCRRSYVHPAVFEAYQAGVTIDQIPPGPRRPYLSVEEAAVLALLKRHRAPARRETVAA